MLFPSFLSLCHFFTFQEDKYFTIHVTPQVECAYVSFETNVNEISYKELINKVLRIFKPGQFTLTFFANKVSICV